MIKKLLEKKKVVDEAWEKLKNEIMQGKKIEAELIAHAMDQCNVIDQQILDYNKSFAAFMKSRESSLVDCNVSSGDEEIDAVHQELREQFQQIYGKDIKHG